MSAQPDLSKLSVGQFAERFRGEMIPLSNTFSYFCASVPLSEEDVKEYLEEPIAALPPAISALLPKVSIMLVPYLERADGKEKGMARRDEFVCTEKPPENRLSSAPQVRFDKEVQQANTTSHTHAPIRLKLKRLEFAYRNFRNR